MLLYGRGNDLNFNGFESYNTCGGVSDEGQNAAIEQIANALLSEESNYVQELLLRESAMLLDTTIYATVL
jgi:hypothetical protein